MGKIKDELENVAFKYAYPDEYSRIHREVEEKKKWAIDRLEALKEEIKKIFDKYKIPGVIRYRINREVSIYNKIKKQDISMDKVFDLLALRIITDTVENCYAIMGDIHQRYQHIPSRWRDFITNPKSNGYQSIHTTIVTQEGIIFEIQIRTREMDDVAEEGIAAHWSYKEGISFLENDQRLDWFRDLIENHKSNPNPRDFLSLVKGDLTPDEIYVVTPKGKVINLKAGSTPVDFAYAIHTEVGNHCRGSVVNEKLVPLRTELNSGAVVANLTSKNNSPSSDWLKFVVTSRARKKITGYFQRRENILFVEKGRRIWSKILRDLKKKYKINYSEDEILEKISRLHYSDMESFFRDIGSNKRLLDRKILKVIFPKISAGEIESPRKISDKKNQEYKLVEVEGYGDIDIIFAKCCNPIKGDDVVGYMTQKRGLVVHKKTCSNVKNVLPSRLKTVTWKQDQDHSYQVKYDLIVQDRPGILSAVSSINADYNSNIKKIDNEYISQLINKIKITFEVTDIKQLHQIAGKYRKIKGMYSVIRKRIAER